jgi:hypothetical protein
MSTTFWLENLKGRCHSEDLDLDLDVDGEVGIKMDLTETGWEVWVVFIWLR